MQYIIWTNLEYWYVCFRYRRITMPLQKNKISLRWSATNLSSSELNSIIGVINMNDGSVRYYTKGGMD